MLDVEKNRPDAVLLQAQALAESGSTESDRASCRQAAIAQLKAAVAANPQFVDAFHTLAEIHLKRKDAAAAAAVLKDDLKANPKDAPAASLLIEILAQGAKPAKPNRRRPGRRSQTRRSRADRRRRTRAA